jgi:hypothetical protein
MKLIEDFWLKNLEKNLNNRPTTENKSSYPSLFNNKSLTNSKSMNNLTPKSFYKEH